ncbi:hypothetical protein MCUN1_002115 [Malassezia cuniculi]|uniref:AAA+ ATPase domain-containing protein n=1 Tax=Malassezia cuniculi TaxID=948313 RepID=A0AAF0J738_9BASI|nr:hypothetical protein MCUN1_002115 [Malassezia cuniculi]
MTRNEGDAQPLLFPIFAPQNKKVDKKAPRARQTQPQPAQPAQPRSRAVRGTVSAANAHPFFAKRETKPTSAPAPELESLPSFLQVVAEPAPWPSADTMHTGAELPRPKAEYELPPRWSWRKARRTAANPCDTPFPYTTHEAPVEYISRAPLTCDNAKQIRTGLGIEERANRGELVPEVLLDMYYKEHTRSDALPWSDRWRPSRAGHVLSNEQSATYLRDWLAELRVSHAARKRQVRTRIPQRKRGRPRIYDDEYVDDYDSDEEAWFEQFRDEASRAAYARRQPTEELSNCILLVGPSGSGKSAAVHACAAELGYEVFELYPGWGRRSGKDIGAAVAQLTRNHMVGEARHAAPKQSLILLDEVDVLFDDDAGFWPAVIELVGASQRPVVLTCTDASLVPTNDLPLQRQLEFVPPKLEDVAAYLSLVALHEGHAVSRTAASKIYLETRVACSPFDTTVAKASGPEHPATFSFPIECRTSDDARAPDLRAALVRLQWECLAAKTAIAPSAPLASVVSAGAMPEVPRALAPLVMLARMADTVSQCDTLLHQVCDDDVLPMWSRAAVSDIPCIRSSSPGPLRDTMLSHAAHASALAAVLAAAVGVAVGDSLHPRVILALASQLDAGRVAHTRHTARLLALLGVWPGEQLPRASSVVEYAPYIRLILMIDELRLQTRAQQLQSVAGGARATRNSARLLLDSWGVRGLEHERRLPFGPDEIRAARATTFPQ